MTLKQVILHLYVPFNVRNISLSVTLRLLVVLIDLSLETVGDALL